MKKIYIIFFFLAAIFLFCIAFVLKNTKIFRTIKSNDIVKIKFFNGENGELTEVDDVKTISEFLSSLKKAEYKLDDILMAKRNGFYMAVYLYDMDGKMDSFIMDQFGNIRYGKFHYKLQKGENPLNVLANK